MPIRENSSDSDRWSIAEIPRNNMEDKVGWQK